jgi:hypothetical protein
MPIFVRQEQKFTENTLRHVRDHSKFFEVALACAVDMCRAAAYISPEGNVPLRLVASDIAHEIKVSCERLSCHENYILTCYNALGCSWLG